MASDGAFGSLVRHASDIIMVLGADGAFRYVSPASERWLGYEPAELLGENAFAHLYPDDYGPAAAAFADLLRDAGANPPIELRMRHKDGSWRILEMMGTNLLGDPGVGGVVVNVRDVTERKEAEEALKESHGLLRAVMEGTTDAIFVKDLQGRYLTINRAGAEALGKGVEEVIGKDDAELFSERDGRETTEKDREIIASGETRTAEETKTAGGVERTYLVTKGPYHDGKGNVAGLWGVSRDITERKRAEEALRESEERFRGAFEDAPIGVSLVGLDNRYLRMNRAFCEMLGYPEEELLGTASAEITHPEDVEVSKAYMERILQGEGGHKYDLEKRYVRADGRTAWVLLNVSLVRDSRGEPSHYVCHHQDITERKETEEALRESEQRFRALVQNSSDVVTVVAADGTILYESPAVERVLGHRPEGLIGKNAFGYIHPDDVERVLDRFAGGLDSPGTTFTPVEYRFRHADGSWRHLEGIGNNLLSDPVIGGVVINSRDVTERKVLERELAHQALHDPLTGLPNRRLFEDRLGHALARAGRHDGLVAILYLDLDDLKVVNDSWGHEAGDRLLIEVARRLASCLRDADTAARLGGDEFAVLLEYAADEGAATRTAARVLRALEAPFELGGREVRVSASIGIASSGGESGGELLRKADRAMYRAKKAGKNRHEVFDWDAG